MKKILLFSIILGIVFTSLNVQAQTAAKPKKMTGQIVTLSDVITSKKDKQLTKATAKEALDNGNPLVFLSNKKVYFIQHTNGTFAFKKLADFAHKSKVEITTSTKIKSASGLNCIIMDDIKSLD